MLTLLALSCWAALVGVAVTRLWAKKLTPGPSTSVPVRWPAGSTLPRDAERPTMVVFAHRYCPCTRATAQKLREELDVSADLRVVVVLVGAESAEQAANDLTGFLRAELPQATFVKDEDAQEARKFHVLTAGHVVLYDREGGLRFSGGVTAGRGEADRGPAQLRLRQALAQLRTPARVTSVREGAVYGCALLEGS